MLPKDPRSKYFFIILGLLGLLSLVLSFLPSFGGTVKAGLTEFAVAVFIAIVLAFTVERYVSEEFQHKVEQALQLTRESVLEAVYSTLMPDAIFKEVRDLILAQPFVRKDVSAVITMRWPDDGDRATLDFNTTLGYDVQNVSGRTYKYMISAQLSRPNDPHLRDMIRFDELAIGRTPPTRIVAEELAALLTPDDTHLTLRKEISLPPKGSQYVALRFWRRIECDDYYTLNMGSPTEGLALTVYHPPEIVERLRINHPAPDRVVGLPGSEVSSSWTLQGGILPYQGLEIWWYPKEQNSSEQVAKAG
jgi:hypothetical protein